jgi:precorrin-6x reductase
VPDADAHDLPRVLILAGTAEGRAIAETLASSRTVSPIVSLAGLTDAEAPPASSCAAAASAAWAASPTTSAPSAPPP